MEKVVPLSQTSKGLKESKITPFNKIDNLTKKNIEIEVIDSIITPTTRNTFDYARSWPLGHDNWV